MNVILQTLLHNPILTVYFLGNGHPSADCQVTNCVSCAVSEAFAEFHNEDKTEGFSALNVLTSLWMSCPVSLPLLSPSYPYTPRMENTNAISQSLAGYQQQDAHEFYQFLVDKLHYGAHDSQETANNKCRCFFQKAFFGTLRSTVTCDKCGNVTKTEDPMLDLSLDVQIQRKKKALGAGGGQHANSPTLDGCLESFTAPEKLMADAYNCSGCGNTQQKATKQLRIRRLPAILCIQLKVCHIHRCFLRVHFSLLSYSSAVLMYIFFLQRFERTTYSVEKLEGNVEFPLSINMLPYTTRPRSHNILNYLYDLSSAVVHKGKLDAGHYYAYCRQGEQVSSP